MNLQTRDAVTPDGVAMPDGETYQSPTKAWEYLDPCPACGSRPHDAPEGLHPHTGDPRWEFEHCFKCGYRPGVNSAVDTVMLRKQFEAFQKFVDDTNEREGVNRTALYGGSDTTSVILEQLQAMREEMASMRNASEQHTQATSEVPTGDATGGNG